MSSLYEIDNGILELLEHGFNLACIDEETGEINTEKAEEYLEALQLERGVKIENIAVYVKSLTSEAEAIKAEEKRLKERREQKERKAAERAQGTKGKKSGAFERILEIVNACV